MIIQIETGKLFFPGNSKQVRLCQTSIGDEGMVYHVYTHFISVFSYYFSVSNSFYKLKTSTLKYSKKMNSANSLISSHIFPESWQKKLSK